MGDDSQDFIFTITEADLDHKRLDVVITKKLENVSRSIVKKLFQEGHIVSDQKIELKKMPPVGTEISITLPEPAPVDVIAQNIPLEILYEDEYLLIINKPAGLVVHPAAGNPDGTLVNAILYHCPDLKGIGHEKRPGIVHRLDKGTSGVMVVAKEQKCHEGLVKLFSTHDIERYYQAIVLGGRIPQEATIDAPIGRNPNNRLKMAADVKNSKPAQTHLKVMEYFKSFSHVELKLETGRTHQIRVHLSQKLNAPIVNDPLYGRSKEEQYQMSSQLKGILKEYEHPLLHAKVLGFKHPITGKGLRFETEPPAIFQDVLEYLRSE
jgi:23S rRNA pseudouridine1911/1915/1917 synthase